MTGMATVVAFHAHPDDEVLLTGGTLAWLAAEGHRTVVVVACCGGLGADPETRLAELRASAAWLGVARVVHLGYADSGHGAVLYPDPPGFTPRSAITHRVDVHRFARPKQAALAAHRTQVYGRGRAGGLFRLLVRLPVPVFGLVAGREWFAEPNARSVRPVGDVLQPAAPAQGTVRR
jgi:LmbE family N-acetylglucosaminyl deacetylase